MHFLGNIKKIILKKLAKRLNEENFISTHARLIGKSFISGSTLSGQVTINENCKIYKSFLDGDITIGRHSSIWGPNIYITSKINEIMIGNFCSIARNVSIQEYNHKIETVSTYHLANNIFGEPVETDLFSKGSILIGHDVWIGAGSVILSGVKIGNGSVVGANSLVNKDVPPFSIVGGNPAKFIRYRFSKDKINELEQLRWWDWSTDKILENKDFFLQRS